MNGRASDMTSLCGVPRVLVFGYGNPGRQDDGLGPAAASEIQKAGWANVTTYDNYQLNIEDAIDVAGYDVVWFIDAQKTGPSPYSVRELSPASSFEFTSHIVHPEVILALSRRYFGQSPQAFLLAIRGYEFEFIEKLTAGASHNLLLAIEMLSDRIAALYEQVPI